MSSPIKSLFDSISPRYDFLNTLLSLGTEKLWRKKTITHLSMPRDATFATLDLCAGTLALSRSLLKKFPHAKIFAVDFSQEMLNHGLKKLPASMSDHIIPVCADALQLPFPSESMDVVMCGYGLRNVEDLEKALTEIRRVLKPNGQLLVLEFFRPVRWITKIFFNTYAPFIVSTLGRLISRHKSAYTYLRESILKFVTTQEFVALLQKKGFADVAVNDFLMSVSTCVAARRP